MGMSDKERAMQKEDHGDYYLTVLSGHSIFRVTKPRNAADLIKAAQAYHSRAGNTVLSNDYRVYYKGIEIVGSLQGAGIPCGAKVEVRPLGLLQ